MELGRKRKRKPWRHSKQRLHPQQLTTKWVTISFGACIKHAAQIPVKPCFGWVLFSQSHAIDNKERLIFSSITWVLHFARQKIQTPDHLLQVHFHSNLFSYIFKYLVKHVNYSSQNTWHVQLCFSYGCAILLLHHIDIRWYGILAFIDTF